jgi:hypothetical protein
MELFHVIDDANVILRAKGVYKQAKVYHRAGGLYAAASGGFVRLYAKPGTSNPNLSWDDIDVAHGKDSLGRPTYTAPVQQAAE